MIFIKCDPGHPVTACAHRGGLSRAPGLTPGRPPLRNRREGGPACQACVGPRRSSHPGRDGGCFASF